MDYFDVTCPDCEATFIVEMVIPPEECDVPYETVCLCCKSLLIVLSYWCEYGNVEGLVTSVRTMKRSTATPTTNAFPYPVPPTIN